MADPREEEFFKSAPTFTGSNAPEPKAMPSNPPTEEEFFKKAPSYGVSSTTPKISESEPNNMSWPQYIGGALSNVPSDVGLAAENFIEPFKHPTETLQALGSVGTGLYSKAAGALGATQDANKKVQDEAAVNAIGKHLSDQYGSKEAFTKSFYQRPVQTLMDISAPFTLGETALARAPGIIGDIGVAAGKVGAVTDPIRMAAAVPELASKAITGSTAIPLAFKSGATLEGLNQAAKAGRTGDPSFWSHWTGSSKPVDLVDAVQDAHSKLAKIKNDEYVTAMQGQKSFTDPLSYGNIDKAVSEATASNTTARGAPTNKSIQDAINATQAKINEFKTQSPSALAHTITDMDDLKKSIDEIRANYRIGTPEHAVLTKIRQSVFDTIKGADSGYANIMENYADRAQQLRDIRAGVMAGTNPNTSAAVKKLISAQGKGYTKGLIDELAKVDPTIPARIAGTELNEVMPIGLRGYLGSLTTQLGLGGALGAMFHPAALGALAVSSPKVAGGLQYTLGALTGRPSAYLKKAQEAVPSSVRAPLYEAGELERQQNPNQQANGGRIGRATGGRTNGALTADMLVAAAERAKKGQSRATEPLLNQSDEAITHALSIANKHI